MRIICSFCLVFWKRYRSIVVCLDFGGIFRLLVFVIDVGIFIWDVIFLCVLLFDDVYEFGEGLFVIEMEFVVKKLYC